MRSPSVTLILFTLALAAAVACGGDGDSRADGSDPTLSNSTTPRPVATSTDSDERLRGALLTVDELGEGWLQQSIEDAGGTVADSYYCGKKVESLDFDAIALFVNPSKKRPFMFEAISQFSDDAAAEAAIDQTETAHDGCSDWISTDVVRRTDWHTVSLEAGAIGDRSLVEKATGEMDGLPGDVSAVFVLAQRDAVVLTVAIVGLGDLPLEEGLRIAEKAMSKYDSTID